MIMIPDSDIERARVRWDVIAADVALKRKGRELIGLCPLHAEKTPSFYVSPDKGFFHCFGCNAHGTAIDYLMRTRNMTFIQAASELLGLPPQRAKEAAPDDHIPTPSERPDAVAEARSIWAEASADRRGTVELYFRSRYILRRQPVPPTIREHPALYCADRRRALPALVAAIQDSTGFVSAVQRIWLEHSFVVGSEEFPDGPPKGSRIDAPKKTRGEMRDGCVRLAPPGPILGLAEGIETGFAAMAYYRVPVWVTCGTARMPTVWVPPTVEHLIVFGDRGAAGEEWASKAVEAHSQRRVASMVFPGPGFSDFQEQLRAQVLGRCA